jgi:type III secretory pathway component EscV
MKIIITESQYKLISEREDNKYMKELNAVYRLFVDKFNKRDFTQRQLITQKGFILTFSMTLNTDFGDLIVQLTEERWAGYGQYYFDDSGVTVPKIIIYNCKFALGDENYVNHRGSKTQMKKIIGISGFNIQALKHEIIHFIDDKKNRKLNQKPIMSQKDWHNDLFEINAEFLSIMNEIRFTKDYVLPETFEDFLNSYKRFNVVTISQWENLTDKKKKSLVGRLYQYYTFLKDVFKKKKEKEANNI